MAQLHPASGRRHNFSIVNHVYNYHSFALASAEYLLTSELTRRLEKNASSGVHGQRTSLDADGLIHIGTSNRAWASIPSVIAVVNRRDEC